MAVDPVETLSKKIALSLRNEGKLEFEKGYTWIRHDVFALRAEQQPILVDFCVVYHEG